MKTGIDTRTFALLLCLTEQIGGRTVTKVLIRNNLLGRTPEEFLQLSPEAMVEEYKVNRVAATSITADPSRSLERARQAEAELNRLGILLVTSSDVHYPSRIEELDSIPPALLFLYGNKSLLQKKTFTVLASRMASAADLNLIEKVTEEGVLAGEILVSGHDRLEYQRSAIVPLRWGAPRILCLDRGFFEALGKDLKEEPFRTARLWRYEFDPQTDLVVSPFLPHAKFIGVNNQVRDRLVASLSDRLDFIHLSPNGNMEKLLKTAVKVGRKVRVSDRILNYRSYVSLGADELTT